MLAPGFLSDPKGEKVVYTLHLLASAVLEWAWQGMQGHWPTMCDESCLEPIGHDRGIHRGFDESVESYRVRLLWWWGLWRGTGHAYPMLEQLANFALPSELVVRIVTDSAMYYTRAADGTMSFEQASPDNWDWDGAAAWYRCWPIIYDPTQAAFDATPETIATLRDIVGGVGAGAKPAHADAWWIIIEFGASATYFTPTSSETDGAYNTWSKTVAGVRVPRREATARYIDGTIAS
jgi:hypothetical protein